MNAVLRLLRIYVLFRLLSVVPTWALLWLPGSLPARTVWVAVPVFFPFLFVWIPGIGRWMGRERYLALALGLLIGGQSLELTVTTNTELWQPLLAGAGEPYWTALLAWRGELFFYLLVPVVLAAWVFGRRGSLWAATWAAVTYVLGGLWLWQTEAALPLGYLLTLPTKLLILYFVPYAVAHLADAQRRQQAELQAAHTRLQRQAALAEQLATSRERNRLGRELHDTLAHSLSGLSVQLQAADVLLDHDPAAARASLRAALGTARAGLDEARRAVAALRASPLEDLGLVEALHRRLAALGERAGLETAWQAVGDFCGLDPIVEGVVYRVADEALLNAERHAAARRICVRLARAGRGLQLTVEDDGQGFDPSAVPQSTAEHFGLAGMRERAELAGCRLEVDSSPQRGTTVRLTLEEEDRP